MSEEEEESATAVFKAFIPPIKSGILIYGDGTGGSIKLEIPQAEKEIFHLLMDMTQEELIVTVTRATPKTCTDVYDAPDEKPKREVARVDLRRSAKRRNQ